MRTQFNSIDEYIAEFPADVREMLETIRFTIAENAPLAEECINYGMPTFKLEGNLVHFAAYKNHLGFYPGSSGVSNFEKELMKYPTSKGAIQFPLNEDVPVNLIAKIVKFRVKENLEKAAVKKSAKKKK
jgi:uncharacterized protein YdhG (YjbR/CyaY superfamily)